MKRVRDEDTRKKLFNELIEANKDHLAIIDLDSPTTSVLDLICVDSEGASQRISGGHTPYQTANAISHCLRKVHADNVSKLNISRAEQGLPPIPAFKDTSTATKHARATGVAKFFPSQFTGRLSTLKAVSLRPKRNPKL